MTQLSGILHLFKVAPDVDISQSKPVVTVSDTEKIPDPTFKNVVTGLKKHSNLNVFKHSDDMGYSKTEAHRKKLKSLAPSGPRHANIEPSFASNILDTWFVTSKESMYDWSLVTPISFASLRHANRALYSASLLEALK
uniref:Uncharacterized protein n=1 Tax=Tanacetum cinerariifolium TaxID=118510 RepID=A0A699IS03_TANCI|nr:hypothetical protein [Tanacetum cinerariifolium]